MRSSRAESVIFPRQFYTISVVEDTPFCKKAKSEIFVLKAAARQIASMHDLRSTLLCQQNSVLLDSVEVFMKARV